MPANCSFYEAPPVRKPVKQAPHAYAKMQQPETKNPGTGRFGGIFPKVSGGSMQSGGKRRPNRKP